MKKKLFPIISLCTLALLTPAAAETPQDAAQAAYAEIVFVQGSDLLVLRSNGQTMSEDPIGMQLYTGDQVQTGPKTSVELVTMPRRSRLRLSENTVVTMGSLGSDGTTILNLIYGRLRSKVEKLAGIPSPYKVSSPTYVAGVRGTDFGCDVLVARSGETTSTQVYCFEGSVEVGPLETEAPGAAKPPEAADASHASFAPVLVSAGAVAVIGVEGADAKVDVAVHPIDNDTRSFWKANDFTSAQPISAATPIPPPDSAPAISAPMPVPEIDLTPIRKGIAAKNGAMAGTCAFFSLGAALMIASFYVRQTDSSLADNYLSGGAICAAAGLPILFFAISIDPLRGVKR